MQLSSIEVKRFQKKLLSWYKKNKRNLPWREMSDGISLQDRAYRILISEVMLQQTQVSRVIPKYEAWLEKFPTVEVLANAPTSDVLRLWSGLGYNRRALNLQNAAKMICLSSRPPSRDQEDDMDSRLRGNDDVIFPRTIEHLKNLPGVGEYTARAILCFAFNEQVAVVDTNVRKVILTLLCQKHPERGEESRHVQAKDSKIFRSAQSDKTRLPRSSHSLAMTEKEIREIAAQLLPRGKAGDWNQALMDYAALVLKGQKVLLKKQSAFKGSRRYFRGKLLKILLREGAIEKASIRRMLTDDVFLVSDALISEIVREMENDGFVRTDKVKIYLQS